MGEWIVTIRSTIELTKVPLKVQIGFFEEGEPDPCEHRLDLTLVVDASLVFVDKDGMQRVFDYDPLLDEIHQLCNKHQYETQELFASQVVRCCAAHQPIKSLEVCLKKFRPDSSGGTVCGTIGVRLDVDPEALKAIRS